MNNIHPTEFPAEYRETVEHVQGLLRENAEWIERFAGYAARIKENAKFIEGNLKRFHQWKPLFVYLNTISAMDATETSGTMKFGLRYRGHEVAKLICTPDKIFVTTKGESLEKANKAQHCSIILDKSAWRSEEATAFRNYYVERDQEDDLKKEERRIESMLLTDFSKTGGQTKRLRYIQPVINVKKVRFQMPTPLSASDSRNIHYITDNKHGGIDILARVGDHPSRIKLCVIELKREYSKSNLNTAIKEALTYSVFIRELLRSDSGLAWWKLFGFGSKLPDNLTLYAAIAMPLPKKGVADTTFCGMEHVIKDEKGEDKIQLHYIYFEEVNNKLKCVHTSLPNTVGSKCVHTSLPGTTTKD
jgi:hypothetical protein